MTKLALVEVFSSPQGEGYHAGRWAVFVRLAGCPLACEFAPGVVCDTPYMQANILSSVAEVFHDLIPPLLPYGPREMTSMPIREAPMLILTGGEPTAAPLFDELVERGKMRGFYVAVETNGTRWKSGLHAAHWISVSPKEDVPQTSRAQWHNHNPQSPALHGMVREEMWARAADRLLGGEYRYVVSAATEKPPYYPANAHYLSPAVLSSGDGKEWESGFPGFAPGAVERCLEIARRDPRWHISIQAHKVLGVR